MTTPNSPFLYWAFISYCREDNRGEGQCWADWLQKKIQGFRIPDRFAGIQTGEGVLGKRLGNVFLDRTDLEAGHYLTDAILGKLHQSRFLLVLGSPASAKSKWVGLEIEEFVKFHGPERVLLIAIDGQNEQEWVHPKYVEGLGREDLPLYVDLRAVRPHGTGRRDRIRGRTSSVHFGRMLDKVYHYQPSEIKRQVASYESDHREATFKLLGQLTGLSPRDLNDEATRDEARRQRGSLTVATSVAAVMCFLLATVSFFYQRSETDRRSAERSLQMIGDAHQSATRLLADVIVDLRANLPPGTEGPMNEAEQTVRDNFDENEPSEMDDANTHMRSVVLNSRGYLARRTGNFSEAQGYYAESKRIRHRLLEKEPDNAMYQHNIAVSLDAEGDLLRERFLAEGRAGRESSELLVQAIESYHESLRISEALANRPDATTQWKHDYAVSCFKVGDVLFLDGELEGALEVLEKGRSIAQALAEADPDYPKYQAHLALFHLEIGRRQPEDSRNRPSSPRRSGSSASSTISRQPKPSCAGPRTRDFTSRSPSSRPART